MECVGNIRLDELVRLDDEDMNRLLLYYKEGNVPPYGEIHQGRNQHTSLMEVLDGIVRHIRQGMRYYHSILRSTTLQLSHCNDWHLRFRFR